MHPLTKGGGPEGLLLLKATKATSKPKTPEVGRTFGALISIPFILIYSTEQKKKVSLKYKTGAFVRIRQRREINITYKTENDLRILHLLSWTHVATLLCSTL